MNGAGITDLMSRVVAASTEPPAQIGLPGVRESVAAARRFVRHALPGCPRADDLILAVSELVSNSIAHSASGHGGAVVVQVRTAPRGRVSTSQTMARPGCRRNATAGACRS